MEDRIRTYATKLGVTPEQLKAQIQGIAQELKRIHPQMSDDVAIQRALTVLYVRHRSELVSRAEWFKGIFLGVSDVMDVVARMHAEVQRMVAQDKLRAISLKYLTPDGKPADYRPTLADGKTPNPRYGLPLPDHMYVRIGLFYGLGENSQQPTLYQFIARGDCVNIEPQLFKMVRFRALSRPTGKAGFPLLVTPSPNVFKIEEIANDPNMPRLEELFEGKLAYLRQRLSNVTPLHRARGPTYCIVCGEAMAFREGANVTVFSLWDEDLPEQDERGRPNPGVPIFCRGPVRKLIDFGEGSRVYVIGRTTRTRTPTGEEAGAGVSAMGIYAIPEFKIPRVVEEVPEAVEIPEGFEPVEGPGLW